MLTTNKHFVNALLWVAATLTALNGLLVAVLAYEFYHLTTTPEEYPWGSEGPFPWYYANKTTYLTYTGVWAAVFIVTLAFQAYFLCKNRMKQSIIVGAVYLLLLIAQSLVSGPSD